MYPPPSKHKMFALPCFNYCIIIICCVNSAFYMSILTTRRRKLKSQPLGCGKNKSTAHLLVSGLCVYVSSCRVHRKNLLYYKPLCERQLCILNLQHLHGPRALVHYPILRIDHALSNYICQAIDRALESHHGYSCGGLRYLGVQRVSVLCGTALSLCMAS